MPNSEQQALPQRRKAVILGLPILSIAASDIPDYLAELVGRRRPAQIALGTLPLAMAAHRDVLTQSILAEAEAVLCSSHALARAARKLGTPTPTVFEGKSLVALVATTAAQHGWNVGLFGPETNDLSATAALLHRQHPSLRSLVTFTGPAADEEDQRRALREAKLDLLLVGLPPHQEAEWIYRQLPWLGPVVILGVGDGLAVTSGRVRRAPEKFSRRGLSWLYELARHPWTRVPLYWIQLWFYIRRLNSQRRSLHPNTPHPTQTPHPENTDLLYLSWSGRVTAATISSLPPATLTPQHNGIVLDLSGVTFMDSSGLGQLLKTYQEAKAQGAGFVLLSPSLPVRELLTATQLDRLLSSATTPDLATSRCRGQTPRLTPTPNRARPGELVLICQGDLTAPRINAANRWLVSAWDAHPGSIDLTLDLEQVRLLDSSGISWLLQARRLARARGGEFALRHVTGQPAQVLAQTHLLQVLNSA